MEILPPRLAVTIKEACFLMSISRAHIYRLIKGGKLDAVKVGTRNLILMSSINRLLRAEKEAA